MMRIAMFAVAAAVGAAVSVPVSAQTSPRLGELKLVSEQVTTLEELGAGNQNGTNGNRNGNNNGNKGFYGHFGYYWWYHGDSGYYWGRRAPTTTNGEIGDLDFVDDSDVGEPAAR